MEGMEGFILSHLDEAIEKKYIQVYYQPIVRTVSRQQCGAEALARWNDPEMGRLSPGLFIPVLEKYHRIHILDECIARQALEHYDYLLDNRLPLCPLSLNLSCYDFEDADIFQIIEDLCQQHSFPRNLIRIEITENALAGNPELLRAAIEKFHRQGYHLWLDDFGRGYSSLDALKDFSFETLKFDFAFVRDLDDPERSEKARIILQYTMNMAKKMHISTLTEGVETEEEFQFLQGIGCEMIQGYLFGRPAPFDPRRENPLPIEAVDEQSYYSTIGSLEIENTDSDSTLRSAGHIEPMAVIEYRDNTYNMLFRNSAFDLYIDRLGLTGIFDAGKILAQPTGVLQDKLRRFIRRLRKGEKEARLSAVIQGRLIDLWAYYLAENPVTGAIAFAVTGTARESQAGDRTYDFEQAMQGIYRMYDRLDLVDLGSLYLRNCYVNTTEYGRIYEGHPFPDVAAAFAEKHIAEDQREDYLAYTDLTTLKKRLQESGRSFVSKLFDTILDDGRVQKKQYMILYTRIGDREIAILSIAGL